MKSDPTTLQILDYKFQLYARPCVRLESNGGPIVSHHQDAHCTQVGKQVSNQETLLRGEEHVGPDVLWDQKHRPTFSSTC